jgi:hypothetical protein
MNWIDRRGRCWLSLTAAFAVLVLPAVSSAQGVTPGRLYRQAVQALERGDCYTAANRLRRYRAALGTRLDAQPEFKRNVNRQIEICDDVAEQVRRTSTIRAPAPPP